MTTRHLVDPEILPLLDLIPPLDLTAGPIENVRAESAERFAMIPPPVIAAQQVMISGRDGPSDIAVFLYLPDNRSADAGAILHIHGGGMVMGSAAMFGQGPAAMAAALGVPVASVEYRLAPEHPFPAPQEDCYAALEWLAGEHGNFGFSAERIIVTGESAGGGLATAVALMARDRNGPALAGQLLVYPMLDHRTGGDACPYGNVNTGEFVWTRASNRFGWEALRGDYAADDARQGWFSPSLAENLSALPPTYIATGSLDLFFDEDVDYARRLAMAGVPVELHSYAGAIHGFNLMAEADVSKRFAADLLAAAARMTGAGL